MTVSTQLLLMDKINFHPTILGPSITSTFKGLTRIRPLSCGFDSSVGRTLHWHRRGRGFESRSEPEFFSGLCSSSVTAALALMTVNSYLSFTHKAIIQAVIYFCSVFVMTNLGDSRKYPHPIDHGGHKHFNSLPSEILKYSDYLHVLLPSEILDFFSDSLEFLFD